MTTQAPTAVTDLASAAAAAAAQCLASGEALAPGEPTADATSYQQGGQALVVAFSGSFTGELVVVVDAELCEALQQSAMGDLDLAAALAPAIEQIASALGNVALGPVEAMDARLALHRAFAFADAAFVPLLGSAGVRGGVAVGIEIAATDDAVKPFEFTELSAQRLDILRGVEMAATAELGRARMTVNDLLSLRNGAVIELDRAAGAPADLYVNGRLIARGEVVVVDENYGLRITQVVTEEGTR